MLNGKRAIALSCSLMLAAIPGTSCLALEPQMNFKIYSPQEPPITQPAAAATDSSPAGDTADNKESIFDEDSSTKSEPVKSEPVQSESSLNVAPLKSEVPEADAVEESKPAPVAATPAAEPVAEETKPEPVAETKTEPVAQTASSEKKVLQGYIHTVPTGTKIPIIMDTAVDSDTSQEGDEFSARTAEDLTIDGSTVVPAGSIIKGRIAQMNGPRALNRSGSVALKFDTITTPDNRQIPLVANIVARGGVVHARRGLKDIALDAGTVSLPTLCGLGIGALAGGSGNSSSSSDDKSGVGRAGGAMIGAGIGLAVGVAVLLAKKGKKVEVRPGDELKIELAEDLRMPTM